ncbi:MAG: diacylglycerol kinase family lipid kinase [Acidobacteria bacterium]|nr:diacylglycerol kinase family lipid kinase [Acidobacteriota bacterium]
MNAEASGAAAGPVRFLLNPAAGRWGAAARLDRLRVLASAAGAGLVVSKSGADIAVQARRAVEDGVARLVVAGGDGTMHQAAQGLAGSACALGVVPLGTGNDLAGTLGIPHGLEAAAARALAGEVRQLDLVRVERTFCIGYAGVGFDSEVTRFANEEVKRLRGPLVYVYAVLHTLATFKPPVLRVVHDAGVFEGPAMFAVVANLPRFGGGMRIAPAALPDDGWLDLVIVRALSRLRLLAVFPQVYRGTHVNRPEIQIVRTKRAEITLDREMTLYGGGEPVATHAAGRPYSIEVVPGALRVVA